MASYDDIFGSGNGGRSFLSIKNEDEKVEAIFLGYDRVPDRGQDGKPKFMVQVNDGDKWGPKSEAEFDPDEVAGSFPLKQLELKLEVDGKVLYHTLSKTSEDAFKDALKKAGGIDEGDTIGLWLVSTAKKPYTWKHIIVRKDSE